MQFESKNLAGKKLKACGSDRLVYVPKFMNTNVTLRSTVRFACGILALAPQVFAEGPLSREQSQFFETKIRPVLVEHCYSCHAADAEEIQGGLVLDTREGIRRGGDTGPAVVPGKLRESLLIKAISYTDKNFAMPPKESGGKLPDQVIRDFERWISDGAADPRDGAAVSLPTAKSSDNRAWWSFQPIAATSPPKLDSAHPFASWVETDIDRFVADRWSASSLYPMQDADPRAFLRRLTFDLIGLPPSREEMESFVKSWEKTDNKRGLIESALDRLLDSKQYGERWGRRWLDVARYAESSGKDVNVVYTHAWRYRDYVIDAFQHDKPFNRFVLEQIAGDQLSSRNAKERSEQLIATGFLAIGPKSLNETNPNQFAVDLADEQIDTVTQAFLGLTVACARCHDHKFDPISHRDYTSLAGIFLSTETHYGTPGGVQGRNQSSLLELPTHREMQIVSKGMSPVEWKDKQARLERLRQQQKAALAQRAGGGKAADGMTNFDVVRIITQATQLESELKLVNEGGSPKYLAMAVVDLPTSAPPSNFPRQRPGAEGRRIPKEFVKIADSPFFLRGNINDPADAIPRGIPTIVGPSSKSISPKVSGRLELANALASPKNTLTARVIVNRVWSWMFGQGLVESVDNFGTTGATPSNPELLDFLATRFMKEGWSIKKLIREVALSHVYRLDSRMDETNFAIDPENKLGWRHSPRRLEAEEIRDAIMSVSGSLDLKPEVGSMIGRAGEGPIGGERMMALSEAQIATANYNFRSIYLPFARNVQPEILTAFDLPDASTTDGNRDSTNVPSQALFMLNSDFIDQQARLTAEQILKNHPGSKTLERSDSRVTEAFYRVLNRAPTSNDLKCSKAFLSTRTTPAVESYTGLVRSLLATAEFRILD
jgi:hypothetical protein